MNERAQHILKALIERYIREGQPVGSKALAQDNGHLSSATIRNVLADLEDAGYIFSPHTSAGRIPTPNGYRFFVDSLLTLQPPDVEQIEQYKIQLHGRATMAELMQSASNLLSGITHQVGLVTLPRVEQMILQYVEFLPLGKNRILIVLVLNDQDVQNRVINTDRTYSSSELEQAANFLNTQFAGKDLNFVRHELQAAILNDREQLDQGLQLVQHLADQFFNRSSEQDHMMVAGQENLLNLAPIRGIEGLKDLFNAFTRKQDILHLLDQCLDAEGVQIFIGDESHHKILDGCSMVTAPYSFDGQTVGVLGVLGPARMNYERVIPLVDVTARLLSAAVGLRK